MVFVVVMAWVVDDEDDGDEARPMDVSIQLTWTRVAGLSWGEWGRVVGSSGLWWNGAGSRLSCVAGDGRKLGYMNSRFKTWEGHGCMFSVFTILVPVI
nr:hypothetical protein [Tanacetum cinerariifolium]